MLANLTLILKDATLSPKALIHLIKVLTGEDVYLKVSWCHHPMYFPLRNSSPKIRATQEPNVSFPASCNISFSSVFANDHL